MAARLLSTSNVTAAAVMVVDGGGESVWPLWVRAGVLCAISQVSFPLGAFLGVKLSPVSDSVAAKWMAFGAGALIFATAVQLFGDKLYELRQAAETSAENGQNCDEQCWFVMHTLLLQIGMAVVGSGIYMKLNKMLEEFSKSRSVKAEARSLEAGQELSTSIADKPHGAAAASRLSPPGAAEAHGPTPGTSAVLTAPIAALAPLRQAASSMHSGGSEIAEGNVALSMWLGVVLDGIPEAFMMALKAADSSLETEFLVAILIANFPESFSGASLLKAQGKSNLFIYGMWSGVCIGESLLCSLCTYMLPAHILDPSQPGYQMLEVLTSGAEGLAGGAMLAMISTAMLPEALHGAGPLSGIIFVFGLMLSVLVAAWGAVHGDGA